MKICIIGISEKKPTDLLLLEGAKKNFNSVLFVPISNIKLETKDKKIIVKYRQTDLSKFDIVFLRVPRSKYSLAYLILKNLPKSVFKPQDPESFLICSNRLLLFQTLAQKGLTVSKICFADNAKTAESALKDLNFPILVRVPSDKEKVMLASTQSEAMAMMDTLQTLSQPIFLEELHKEDLLQVFVVGNDVVATLKRKTSEAEYEKYEISKPSRAVVSAALNACRVLKTSFARIDILGMQEPVIVDVDICPFLSKLKDKDIGYKVFKKIKALAEVEKGGIIVKFIEDIKMAFKDIMRG